MCAFHTSGALILAMRVGMGSDIILSLHRPYKKKHWGLKRGGGKNSLFDCAAAVIGFFPQISFARFF